MNKDCINEYIRNNLSKKRALHTYAVRDMALEMAEHYGVNLEKAEFAALLHDICKNLSIDEMNQYVETLGLDSRYINNANLAHSKIAAAILPEKFQITDGEIIDAVSYHTTGRANMSVLEKIIYLADAIEPARTYPGVDDIRALAFTDMDEACILSLTRTIDYVKSQNAFLDYDTEEAARYLKELKIKGDSK